MREDLVKAVEEAKVEKRIVPALFKGALETIDKNLLEKETVNYVIGVNVGILSTGEALKINPFTFKNKKAGILAVTSVRIIHCFTVLFNKNVEQILLEDINNIESKSSFMASVLRIQSMTNVMEIDINNKEVVKVTKLLHELKEKRNSAPQIVNNISSADELAKFKKLLDDGILTQEEFDKKKAQILGI
ncbi:hypothetical protein FACS189447_10950 [Spirochaetia bacterium]|nr:hypothetical protein FACS189447_10950 [Spirochaetia bacterium]